MRFNDLKVRMVLSEVLFKNDSEMHPNYTIKIINNIKAETSTYVYSTDDNKSYSAFKGRLLKFSGPKDFGLSKNINDFKMDDKISFVEAVFGGDV